MLSISLCYVFREFREIACESGEWPTEIQFARLGFIQWVCVVTSRANAKRRAVDYACEHCVWALRNNYTEIENGPAVGFCGDFFLAASRAYMPLVSRPSLLLSGSMGVV